MLDNKSIDYDIKIKNVKIIDKNIEKTGSVLIRDSKIASIYVDNSENEISIFNIDSDTGIIYFDKVIVWAGHDDAGTVIDGKDMVLMPAFADLHSHFRDPGFTYKEDLTTGSKAAVRGGYTSVVLMANTNPVCSNIEVYNDVKTRAKEIGLVDVEPVISISENLKGENSNHLSELIDKTSKNNCIKFLSDDGKGVMSSKMMEDALELSKKLNLVIMSHAEDHSFSSTDMRKAENYMTLRDIYACEQTGARLHMCHVSTKEAIEMIIAAKKKGVNVSCEVTPHHIFLTDEVNYRVNPPLRKTEDVDSIIDAIKSGYVDAIATDHAPHSKEDKENGAPGISGIELSFQLCLTKLVKENKIDLKTLSELMSYNPCKMMKFNKGLMKEGYEADLVLVDVNKKSKIDINKFESKSKNSPLNGYEVYGEVLMTFKAGKIVYSSV
jgi:dihydroorotase